LVKTDLNWFNNNSATERSKKNVSATYEKRNGTM
jgi:hypothetical protein